MLTLKIKAPIWSSRSVGIAEHRLSFAGETLLEIEYTDKHGNRVYPHVYAISRQKVIKYPVETRRGVRLFIVPIRDLEPRVLREPDGTEKKDLFRG